MQKFICCHIQGWKTKGKVKVQVLTEVFIELNK